MNYKHIDYIKIFLLFKEINKKINSLSLIRWLKNSLDALKITWKNYL